jgi:hypothetical protein
VSINYLEGINFLPPSVRALFVCNVNQAENNICLAEHHNWVCLQKIALWNGKKEIRIISTFMVVFPKEP